MPCQGLISGISTYLNNINKNIEIVGVESLEANAMTQSLENNKIVSLDTIGTFADGVAVKEIGSIPFSICKTLQPTMINVTNDVICYSIKYLYDKTRTIMEPAGALAMAGCISYIENNNIQNRNMVVITSGANLDFNKLRYISEKADRQESTFLIEIPERVGSFLELYKKIYPTNITQFSYLYDCSDTAKIIISIDFPDIDDKVQLYNTLSQYYKIIDKTDDEIFMDHKRYMVQSSQMVNQYVLSSRT